MSWKLDILSESTLAFQPPPQKEKICKKTVLGSLGTVTFLSKILRSLTVWVKNNLKNNWVIYFLLYDNKPNFLATIDEK